MLRKVRGEGRGGDEGVSVVPRCVVGGGGRNECVKVC